MVYKLGIDIGSDSIKFALVNKNNKEDIITLIKKIEGNPLEKIKEGLEQIINKALFLTLDIEGIGITGYGENSLCKFVGVKPVNELSALTSSFFFLYPEVKTVIEMGKSSQKYILLDNGEIVDWSFGGKCAAGTGSFVEYMAKRLEYPLEEFAKIGAQQEGYAALSGRCTVFAESDLTHKQQAGTSKEELIAGANRAPVRNFMMSAARQKKLIPKIAIIGGMSLNPAFIKFCKKELGISESDMIIPEYNRHMGAIGAALKAKNNINHNDLVYIIRTIEDILSSPFIYSKGEGLKLEKPKIMPIEEKYFFNGNKIEKAALGIDIGSVSTKAVLITEEDDYIKILASHYRRTAGDPLAAIKATIAEIYKQINEKSLDIKEIVAATTGSGRALVGYFVGADLIKNEITSQAAGARIFIKNIDSIIELGGQDSKYIACEGEANIDNVMIKACAAGTGALLERMANYLGIKIEEFGDYALKGKNPPEFNSQCAVFIEQNLLTYLQNNVPKEDLAAAACIAVAKSYKAKLLENRNLGDIIVFQGAVAKNKGMIAAFESILEKKIIVPPFPELTGPLGIAKLAYDKFYRE